MERRRGLGLTVSFFCMLLFLSGISYAEGLTGRGDWRSVSSDSIRGTWSVDLTRSGSGVVGTMDLTGSNALRTCTITGNVAGNDIILGLVTGGSTVATFTGKLVEGAVSGEWEAPTLRDEGVWYGELQAAAGD